MKLHQLLAFEKDERKRAQEEITRVHRESSTEALAAGVAKRYEPLAVDGMRYPDERSPVAIRFDDAIGRFSAAWIAETDVVARKDLANVHAQAAVMVDGETLISDVPAVHLLFLEKQLEHVRTFVAKLVELPAGQPWEWDAAQGVHKTAEKISHRTEKLQEVLVLLQPTEKHPGQAQVITKDKIVGHWYATLYSGGIPPERKRELLARVAKLSNAVKEARERANEATVPEVEEHAEKLMGHIFN